MGTETVGEAGADMVGEPEILPLTKDLCLLSDGRPSGNGMAWVGSGLRPRLLRRLWVAGALVVTAVSIWGAGFWVLTRPFHEDWPRTGATVVRNHEFNAKGTHCEVYLSLASVPEPRTVMFSGYAPCSELPSPGATVTVSMDPWDPSAVRIIGYDAPLWGDIGLPATLLVQPVLWACVFFLVTGARFRRARKAGGGQPWRAVTARFISRRVYRGGVSARLWALDTDGKERTFVLSGPANALPGFTNGRPGTSMTFWLAGDGFGNVLISQPGAGGATLGRAYAPNEFELRAMA
ncbi:hypothetical protein [Arthrobacter bambusae]|uniref:hypothetical protein n=1 Tax=Arthrobacter bambusae TaxID=1338426 RepID=UPI0027893AF7|nr:hypothetical protein [Arthrobacter bambusae]MDQ0242009.1 hypothetical protein [Arthrobacter bambusae]